MKANNTQCLVLCLLASATYGLCHADWVLAGATMALILSSYVFYLLKIRSDLAFLNISWSVIILIAIVLGALWRLIIMPSEQVHDLLSFLIAILQSSMLFMLFLSWLRPDSANRSYYLQFQAWVTVALAVNINMYGPMFVCFWVFCAVGLGFILYNAIKITPEEKASPGKTRGWRFYGYPVSIFVCSFVLGITIAVAVLIVDRAFVHLVSDYNTRIDPNHFLKMNSFMLLNGPGRSGKDIRPVMAISRKDEPGMYLVTQVFDRYEQGLWKVRQDTVREPLPDIDPGRGRVVKITMFTSFANVIPAPKTVTAVRGKGEFYKNSDDIVYATTMTKTRKVSLTGSTTSGRVENPADIHPNYLQIPENLRERLNALTIELIGVHADPRTFAAMVEQYFQLTFGYTLNVQFKGDDAGIISMLQYTRPAYCTYFASAMALILRAQGVPSRVVTGFLVTEKTGKNEEEFLVRVRDGHAWVEALLPDADGRLAWQQFEPTPSGERENAVNQAKPLLNVADKIWLWSMRVQADLREFDFNKVKLPLLFLLIAILALFAYRRRQGANKEDGRTIRRARAGSNAATADLQKFYEELSAYIAGHYGINRRAHETSRDFLDRLFETAPVPSVTAGEIAEIYGRYAAARFGCRADHGLHSALERLPSAKTALKG